MTRIGVALSPARERVLRVVADLAPEPARLADIAEAVGGHPNTSRQHLDSLVSLGLVVSAPLPRKTPGRRPLGFTLTDAGRAALTSPATVDEYRDLVGAFATYLVAKGASEDDIHAVGELWGAQRRMETEGDQKSIDALVEMLDILGFHPALAATEQGQAVVLRACPLNGLTGENQALMCELHRGMIDGVMRQLGDNEGVRLIPFADGGTCRVEMDAEDSSQAQPASAERA